MKIWNALVITAGIILFAPAIIDGLESQFLGSTILIAGGSIAMSIACLAPRREKGAEKAAER